MSQLGTSPILGPRSSSAGKQKQGFKTPAFTFISLLQPGAEPLPQWAGGQAGARLAGSAVQHHTLGGGPGSGVPHHAVPLQVGSGARCGAWGGYIPSKFILAPPQPPFPALTPACRGAAWRGAPGLTQPGPVRVHGQTHTAGHRSLLVSAVGPAESKMQLWMAHGGEGGRGREKGAAS